MGKKDAPKKPEVGIVFPRDESGERSTTNAGKMILAAALRAAGTPEAIEASKACQQEKKWRFKYAKHFMAMVRVSASSPENALKVSQAGADFMHSNFHFIDPETKEETSFADYMSRVSTKTFHQGVIKGTGSLPTSFAVPYKGKELRGEELTGLLQRWAEYGTIEPDAAATIQRVVSGRGPSLKGKVFVLIGAGSAMGPFTKLLEHGATVVAIDIPGKLGERPAAMWQRLISVARASPGELIIPLDQPQNTLSTDAALIAAAGCNLIEQPAQILRWLRDIDSANKQQGVTIGNYTYLDGDLHVKLSIAADAVIKGMCESNRKTAVAFLCTPTDIHVIPEAAHRAAKMHGGWNHAGKPVEALINVLSGGKFLRPNALRPIDAGTDKMYLVDGLSVAQGPNYALAKRLQHWRAMLAYQTGHVVSSNIAPSTATLSVVSNRTFAWAYGGMPYFKPYEIFQQETTNPVMTALLIADVTDADSAANPVNRNKFNIRNPLELFKHNSVHGGVWRAGYTVDSIGEVSAMIHFLGGPKLFLFVVYGILALIVFAIKKFVF